MPSFILSGAPNIRTDWFEAASEKASDEKRGLFWGGPLGASEDGAANCLPIQAALQSGSGEIEKAQATMASLVEAHPTFSLEGERAYRRFGGGARAPRGLPGANCRTFLVARRRAGLMASPP